MKHNIKYVISLVFMFLLTQGAWADPAVTIIKQLNGSPATTSPGDVTSIIEDGTCTLTVTPAQGNYVTKDFITVYSVVTGNVAQGPRRTPDLDNNPIEVTDKGANTDPTGVTTYEFTMPADGSDAEVTVNFHSITTYNLFIGETQVTDLNADKILGDSKVTFTPGNDNNNNINTLTLNGATLTVPIKVALPNLTIDIQGTNSITTEETCLQKIDDAAPAVTFKSTSSPVGSLALKSTGDGGVNTFGEYNVGSFSISNELTLIMKNSGYVYSNTYYFTDGTTKEAVFAPAYDITIGEMPVTMGNADDIFGGYNDGQVSYDAENNVLTLNSANLYGEGKNIVYTGTDNLTIALNGSSYVNSIAYGGQGASIPELTFTKVEGALPGTTLRTPSDFSASFSEVNYEDWLGLYVDNSYPNDTFYDVMSKTPSIYGSWNGNTEKWEVTVESKFDGTVKYSLTYADENLADQNKTNVPFEEAFTLLGPATIKATITIDNEVSPEETAYYFGVMPNPLKFEYDGETAPTFAATLYPSVEGVSFTPYSSPGSFATISEGEMTINGIGSGLTYANLTLPEDRTFSALTDSIAFRMEVLPVKPTITKSDKITLSVPETLAGDNTSIYYKWESDDDYTLYEEPFDVEVGTLYAQTRVSIESQAGPATVYASEDATAEYIKDIANAYVDGLAEDTIYTGAAIVPTFTVKASADAESNLVEGTDYEVSYAETEPEAPMMHSPRRAPESVSMIDVGYYNIVITGKGAYGGTKRIPFEITQANLDDVTIAAIADQTYTGEDLTPTLTVKLGENTVDATEYTVRYEKAMEEPDGIVEPGVYTVTLISTNKNFEEESTKSATFNILPVAPTIAYNSEVTYLDTDKIEVSAAEGMTIFYTWDTTVEVGNSYVDNPENSDITLSTYNSDNLIAAQTGTLRAWAGYSLGDDEYLMSEVANQVFTVKKDINNAAIYISAASATYTGAAITPEFTLKESEDENAATISTDNYDVSYEIEGAEAPKMNSPRRAPEGNGFSMIDADYYYIIVTAKGDTYGGEKRISFEIKQANLADVEIAAIADMPYNGEDQKPTTVSVTLNGNAIDASEYELSYKQGETPVEAAVEVGEYTVVLTSTGGNFTSGTTATQTFKIINRTLEVGKDVQFAANQKWASFYSMEEDLELPEGVMAYIVTAVDAVNTKKATLTAINYVPKDVPVFLENNSTTTTTNSSADGNLLQGVDDETLVSELSGTVYGLHDNALMKITSGTIPGGRAILVVNGEQNAPRLALEKDGEATGIESLTPTLSEGEGAWYTIDGKKLQKKPTTKGVYIVNGKKMVVK